MVNLADFLALWAVLSFSFNLLQGEISREIKGRVPGSTHNVGWALDDILVKVFFDSDGASEVTRQL